MVARKNVVLKIPEKVWLGFTQFQMGLWFVDEVEARWQRLRRSHPNLSFLTLWWSKNVKQGNGSFMSTAKTLAAVLGLQLADIVKDHKKHSHKQSKAERMKFRRWARRQDAEYRKQARYTDAQRRLITQVQWGKEPKSKLCLGGFDAVGGVRLVS